MQTDLDGFTLCLSDTSPRPTIFQPTSSFRPGSSYLYSKLLMLLLGFVLVGVYYPSDNAGDGPTDLQIQHKQQLQEFQSSYNQQKQLLTDQLHSLQLQKKSTSFTQATSLFFRC